MNWRFWQPPIHQAQLQWRAWWQARTPRTDQLTLTQRRLYILPSKAGWSLGGVVLVLLLASINEQINLGYALSFLLMGVGLATMYRTHANAQGLRLQLNAAPSVHEGDVVKLHVTVGQTDSRKSRWGLTFNAQPLDLAAGTELSVWVDVPALRRGWNELPRMTVHTTYPLGLFRVWAYWRPAARVLIWPALDAQAPALPRQAWEDSPQASARRKTPAAGEDAEGLRAYRRGDALRSVAWKKSSHALASGGSLVSREAAAQQSEEVWLDFNKSPGLAHLDAEARLRRLATWVRQAQTDGLRHGLILPGVRIECGTGLSHARQCLDALAQWTP